MGEFAVSVVIPAYNHESYIEAAINSVLGQSHKGFELVIVNDGSTDRTGEICEKMVETHPWIKYIYQENQGAHAAINNAIACASGKYIAVLNSDDLFMPYKLERCMEIVVQRPEIELVCGDICFIDSCGSFVDDGGHHEWLSSAYDFFGRTKKAPLSLLYRNFVISTSNMFFTKELWHRVGGFQPLRYCHDMDFLLEAIRLRPFHFDLGLSHVQYRVHENNTIKEDADKVRIEVAAVIAAFLVEYRIGILEMITDESLKEYKDFLDGWGVDRLVNFFMLMCLNSGSRGLMYEAIADADKKRILSGLLP